MPVVWSTVGGPGRRGAKCVNSTKGAGYFPEAFIVSSPRGIKGSKQTRL